MLGVDEKHIILSVIMTVTISHGEHGIPLALLKNKSFFVSNLARDKTPIM